jgi:uncharacterized protein (TIGR03083 family)
VVLRIPAALPEKTNAAPRRYGLGVEHWDAIAEERLALADQLDTLRVEQWSAQSLCAAWTVRDVAAHLVAPQLPGAMPRFFLAFVRARGNFDRANEALCAREAVRPCNELVADLRRYASSRFKPPGFGSEAPLTDVLAHGADIRLPLGLPDPLPASRWAPVLEFLVSPKARRGFVPRQLPTLRYIATDIDWTHGAGDDVRGPAATLALTMLGRRVAADDLLPGSGSATLGAWLSE